MRKWTRGSWGSNRGILIDVGSIREDGADRLRTMDRDATVQAVALGMESGKAQTRRRVFERWVPDHGGETAEGVGDEIIGRRKKLRSR